MKLISKIRLFNKQELCNSPAQYFGVILKREHGKDSGLICCADWSNFLYCSRSNWKLNPKRVDSCLSSTTQIEATQLYVCFDVQDAK
jgi:hypothetical protein